tara:strand:- start:453 stop:713 length:261 start_codon:yes stop_codon:yes gene_type:complete
VSREHANGMGRKESIEGDRMSWPHCFDCGEEFNPKRRALGYEHCLECGEQYAQETAEHRKKCTAPLYNKGAYQYVGSVQDARWAGR